MCFVCFFFCVCVVLAVNLLLLLFFFFWLLCWWKVNICFAIIIFLRRSAALESVREQSELCAWYRAEQQFVRSESEKQRRWWRRRRWQQQKERESKTQQWGEEQTWPAQQTWTCARGRRRLWFISSRVRLCVVVARLFVFSVFFVVNGIFGCFWRIFFSVLIFPQAFVCFIDTSHFMNWNFVDSTILFYSTLTFYFVLQKLCVFVTLIVNIF